MTDFSDVLNFLHLINDTEENNRLERLNQNEINQLREKYAEIPNEFLDYLQDVGAGSLNNCR